MPSHLTRGPVIGAKEISDPIVGESRPRTDPSRTNLVSNQPLRKVQTTQIPGVPIF
jgi:hypothetical protein